MESNYRETRFYTWQGSCNTEKDLFEFYLFVMGDNSTIEKYGNIPNISISIINILGGNVMKMVESYDAPQTDDFFDEPNLSQHFYIEKHLANQFRNYIESIGFTTDYPEFGKGILEKYDSSNIKEPSI